MQKKILDTNVLLDNELDLIIRELETETEEDIEVILPIKIVYELSMDKFKRGSKKINEVCRHNLRLLEEIRSEYGLHKPAQVTERTKLSVYTTDQDIKDLLALKTADLSLIEISKNEISPDGVITDEDVSILCNDLGVRILNDIINCGQVKSSAYNDHTPSLQMYQGYSQIDITDDEVQELFAKHKGRELFTEETFCPNEFVIMTDSGGKDHYGIYNDDEGKIERLKEVYEAWGVKPYKDKSGEFMPHQKMAMHVLLDPEVEMVTLQGLAGTGKTYLALAAALEQTLNGKPRYDKILIMRPMADADKEIGALPGDKVEKLTPWLAGPLDNLKSLFKNKAPTDYIATPPEEIIRDLIETYKLEIESFNFLRGRSLTNTFIIVDDFQNSTKEQAMLAVTRLGIGSKIVFLGDISRRQIDNPNLTPVNNGLRYLIDYMAGQDKAIAHLSLNAEDVIRSRIAHLATHLLP